MEQLLRELVPRLSPLAVLSDTCANCTTPTGQAYVGAVAPGLAVATDGNGLAAKQELGRARQARRARGALRGRLGRGDAAARGAARAEAPNCDEPAVNVFVS